MTKKDLAWGLKYGMVIGTFVALMTFIGSSAGGTVDGQNVSGLPPAFLLCGLVGGVTLGAFRHLTRSPWSAALLGAMIGFPYYVIVTVFLDGWSALIADWQFLVVAPLTIGPAAGVLLWFMFNGRGGKSAGAS